MVVSTPVGATGPAVGFSVTSVGAASAGASGSATFVGAAGTPTGAVGPAVVSGALAACSLLNARRLSIREPIALIESGEMPDTSEYFSGSAFNSTAN